MTKNHNPKDISRRELLRGVFCRQQNSKDTENIGVNSKVEHKEPDTEIDFRSGKSALEKGDFGSAIKHFRACVENEAHHTSARMRLGYCLYKQRKYIQAKVEFRRVLHRQKNSNFTNLFLGLTEARKGQLKNAFSAWNRFSGSRHGAIQHAIKTQQTVLRSSESPDFETAADALEKVIEESRYPFFDE